MKFRWFAVILALGAAPLAGCDTDAGKSVTEVVEKAKKKVSGGTKKEAKKETLPTKVEIALNTPVSGERCLARFTTFHDRSSSVLRITSYSSPKDETYPSVLIYAPLAVAKLEDLAGQTVPAEVFVAEGRTGPFWHAAEGEVKIVGLEEGQLTGELVGGDLLNSVTGESIGVSGQFVANVE